MLPFWIRRLHRQLLRQPLIDDIALKFNRMRVRYVTGFRRTYTFRNVLSKHIYMTVLTPETGVMRYDIPIEYKAIPDHFLVRRAEINKGTYMDKEVLVQKLLKLTRDRGWVIPYVAPEEIRQAVEAIRETNRYYVHDTFWTAGRQIGWPIAEKYFDVWDVTRHRLSKRTFQSIYTPKWSRPFIQLLWHMVHRTKLDINDNTMVRFLKRWKFGPRYVSPVLYKILFNQLLHPAGRTIVDPTPAWGSKAVAAAICNANYAPVGGFTRCPQEQAFLSDLGIRVVPATPPYDVVMLDNSFNWQEIEQVMTQWYGKARTILLHVANWQREIAMAWKPHRIIRTTRSAQQLRKKHRGPDWLFCYGTV